MSSGRWVGGRRTLCPLPGPGRGTLVTTARCLVLSRSPQTPTADTSLSGEGGLRRGDHRRVQGCHRVGHPSRPKEGRPYLGREEVDLPLDESLTCLLKWEFPVTDYWSRYRRGHRECTLYTLSGFPLVPRTPESVNPSVPPVRLTQARRRLYVSGSQRSRRFTFIGNGTE